MTATTTETPWRNPFADEPPMLELVLMQVRRTRDSQPVPAVGCRTAPNGTWERYDGEPIFEVLGWCPVKPEPMTTQKG